MLHSVFEINSGYFSSVIFIAMIDTMAQERNYSRILEAETKAKTMEEYYLTVLLPLGCLDL